MVMHGLGSIKKIAQSTDDSLSISGLIAKLQRPSDIFTRLRFLLRRLRLSSFPFGRVPVSFLHRGSGTPSVLLPWLGNDKRRSPVKPWDPIKRGLTTPGTALKFKITRI